MANYELKDVLIKLEDVRLQFGDKVVLAGIDAEVRDIVRPGFVTGQVIGVLGPSGIGKTILSRVLTGLQKPTSGKVTVGKEGKLVDAGLVGFVPQNYPLLRHRTVLGNLKVAAAKRGTVKLSGHAEGLAREYLRDFGLEDKADNYPAELSGGQRQRVAIAQQLLCSEHYLVMDEPTTGLDPIMKDKVIDLIRQVSSLSEENSIFIVSHDIPSILSVADTLWLMGRVRNEKGESIGAKILHQYNLAERGIAWDPNAHAKEEFHNLLREIRSKFDDL